MWADALKWSHHKRSLKSKYHHIANHCVGPFRILSVGVPKHRASSKICPSRVEIPNWATQVGCFWHLYKSTTQHWIICMCVFYLRLQHAVHTFDPLRPWQCCFFTVGFAAPAGQMRHRRHSQQGSQRPCHGPAGDDSCWRTGRASWSQWCLFLASLNWISLKQANFSI